MKSYTADRLMNPTITYRVTKKSSNRTTTMKQRTVGSNEMVVTLYTNYVLTTDWLACLLGMDERRRSGLNTRKARKDFTLTPSICITASREENSLG